MLSKCKLLLLHYRLSIDNNVIVPTKVTDNFLSPYSVPGIKLGALPQPGEIVTMNIIVTVIMSILQAGKLRVRDWIDS